MTKLFKQYQDIMIPDEIAKLFRTDERTIIEMFDNGKLQGFLAGQEWRARKESIQSYVNGYAPMVTTIAKEEKIRKYVRSVFEDFLVLHIENDENSRILSDEEIEKLSTLEYSSQTFAISFPVLKLLPQSYSEGDDISEHIKDNNGNPRYWKKVFGKKYLVTSQWSEENREKFEQWVKSH